MSRARRVVITGCSRGLGRAMVGEFATAGWVIAGCARDAVAIENLRAAFPAPHLFVQADVVREEDVARFCAAVLREQGTPDLLLNNAALINRNAPLWEVPAEEFGRVIDVNIKGTAAMVRHLAPSMIEHGGGVIVNFSSGWGRSTSPEVAPYCATKYAIEGLSQAMAQETGGRLAVVALNPGIIDTEMLRSCFGGEASSYPDAADWARRAVPFLAKLGPEDNGRSLSAPLVK